MVVDAELKRGAQVESVWGMGWLYGHSIIIPDSWYAWQPTEGENLCIIPRTLQNVVVWGWWIQMMVSVNENWMEI